MLDLNSLDRQMHPIVREARPLLIPYAIDVMAGGIVSAADIGSMMRDIRSTLRLQATAQHDVGARKALRFECPGCRGPLYPRAPVRPGGRHFWSHLPRGELACPLEAKSRLTPDQINARIFQGRQEGPAHRSLVDLLVRLANQDPDLAGVERGTYVPPSAAMRAQFPHGRFPDVRFTCNGGVVVLEAQLATITLHGINGRRAFYDRQGSKLVWVMPNFEPSGRMHAYIRDIAADQIGQLFSIDQEIIDLSDRDGRFRLRRWSCVADDREARWVSKVLTISKAAFPIPSMRWSDGFKLRWIETFPSAFHAALGQPDPYDMLDELAERADLPPFGSHREASCALGLVRLLISLEAGVVTGSGHSKLISLANCFDTNEGHRAVSLVCRAIERWQPHLMEWRSMRDAVARARKRLEAEGTVPWGRLSPIGRIRETLFPDWKLTEPTGVRP